MKVNGVIDEVSDGHPPKPEIKLIQAFVGPPEWMTKEYFEGALQEYQKDKSLKILDYRVVSATKPGDNFASIALRLRATYLTKGQELTKSFIVKVEPYVEGFQKEALKETVLFETEISMYSQTISEMQRIIQEVDRTEIIAPNMAYSSLKPHKIVFIEDIGADFEMSEKPLDFERSLQVFTKIGKFHALSVFLHEDHEALDKYATGFVSKQLQGATVMWENLIVTFAQTIGEWGSEMEIISQKLLALAPELFEKLLKLFVVNKSGYNVLNHGDFHVKNILLRRDKENKEDPVRFIDFQLSIWATPAIDLIFALYGMVGHEAREHRQELIRCYHDQFTKTLQQLGYLQPIPTLLDLQVELMRNGLIEVFLVVGFLPVLNLDRSKMEEVEEMNLENLAKMSKMSIEAPETKAVLMKLLPGFLNNGFLD